MTIEDWMRRCGSLVAENNELGTKLAEAIIEIGRLRKEPPTMDEWREEARRDGLKAAQAQVAAFQEQLLGERNNGLKNAATTRNDAVAMGKALKRMRGVVREVWNLATKAREDETYYVRSVDAYKTALRVYRETKEKLSSTGIYGL